MLRTLTFAVLLAAATACGVDGASAPGATGQAQDGLIVLEEADTVGRLPIARSEWCTQETVRPFSSATLREVPALKLREVMLDLGPVVQSALRDVNTEYEELRKGVAEFHVQGAFRKAELRWDEARAIWPYPVAADTHRISAYQADLKPTADDFESTALTVGRFETDVNSRPATDLRLDVTRAVMGMGADVGFRFELEAAGMGTQFDNVRLVLTRCRGFAIEG